MKRVCAPRPAALIVLAALAAAVPIQQAAAQALPPRPARPRGSAPPPPRRPQEPGIAERSLIMQQLEKEANRPPRPETVELALAQIGEDYERIQVVNNRMMAAVMPAPVPDYKLVAETTGELRRRAERLRLNLALPKPDGAGAARPRHQPAADARQLKDALLALDRALMSFVRSPVFSNVGVLEAAAAARAGRDLEDVIELSRRVGKDAEQLGRAAGRR